MQCEDHVYIADIATRTHQVDVLHSDALILDLLQRRLDHLSNITISTTVFPAPEQQYDLVLLGLPKGRDASRAFMATALAALKDGAYLYAAGPNKGGAKTAEADAGTITRVYSLGTKQRHRIFSAQRPAVIPTDWLALAEPQPLVISDQGYNYTVYSQPGIFSHEHLDEGTALLLDGLHQIKPAPGSRVLDAGCGYGIVGMVVEACYQPEVVVMADINLLGLACARQATPTARIIAADVTNDEFDGDAPFDLILCNPPFHKGHQVERTFMQAFAENAKQLLKKNGQMLLVYNSFLPYEDVLQPYFKQLDRLIETNKFIVLRAR